MNDKENKKPNNFRIDGMEWHRLGDPSFAKLKFGKKKGGRSDGNRFNNKPTAT
jgi:hypothetical protein